MPRTKVSANATRAAARNAVRTARTAPGISSIGLRTASTYPSPSFLNGSAARAYSVPSIEPKLKRAWPLRKATATSSNRSDSTVSPSAEGESSSCP